MDPYLGEIRLFAGNFAPKGWALCNGQLMPITQNTALFSLLGTQYGGDGKTTFALPNFQGRAPVHRGQGPGLTDRRVGQSGGTPTVTLLTSEMPAHSHVPNASTAPTQGNPEGAVWSNTPGLRGTPIYAANADTYMSSMAIGVTGNSQPHNNMQPYLGLNFIIALQGVFPPRS